jgi:NitT/TauT family transport system permease protein
VSAEACVRRWWRANGPSVIIYLAAVGLWELGTTLFQVPTFLLPSPRAILSRTIEVPHHILFHSVVTLREVLTGFLLAATVSIPLGVVIVYSRKLERVIYPFLVAFQAVPKVALAPILVVWFGFGLLSKSLLAFVTAMFPIVINTVIGMSRTPPEMIYLMRSLKASPAQIFVKVRLPASAPYIFGGLKIGITLAVVGAVVGEFIASNSGLGYWLLVANNNLDIPLLFTTVVVLAFMSVGLFYLIDLIEWLVLPRPLRRRVNGSTVGERL